MYDFRDVSAASKSEQIRAWSIEQSIDMQRGMIVEDEDVIKLAKRIEEYVNNG